jgi:hypothetical protein
MRLVLGEKAGNTAEPLPKITQDLAIAARKEVSVIHVTPAAPIAA